MLPLSPNPLDALWPDRPPPPASQVVPHDTAHAGRDAAEKRAEIARLLRQAEEDAAVISDPASLCWLLNMRGSDVPYTPLVLAFGLIRHVREFLWACLGFGIYAVSRGKNAAPPARPPSAPGPLARAG